MAIGTDLIQGLNDLDDEISASDDQARALRVLNRAQDTIELVLSLHPHILGTYGTITTTASTETTAEPTGLLRLDRMRFIDPGTSRPTYKLEPVFQAGDISTDHVWPYSNSAASTGKPTEYAWAYGVIWWGPKVPDDTHTIRWYGLASADDITATGTFAYPDFLISPLTKLGARYFKQRVDDPQEEIVAFAQQEMASVIESLKRRWRDGPRRAKSRRLHYA
jgi:hypothetical protein